LNLSAYISKLEKLESKAEVVLMNTIFEEAPIANREQLAKGVKSDENQISFPSGRTTYSPSYKKQKARKGLQNKYVDLKYSGDFYKSIEVKKRSESKFELVSGDTLWTGKLRPIFGKEVLGLNQEATLQVEREIEKDLTALMIKELL
tara:strand:- start:959 stop:1399 length:441 start_codon:yes stop_codon:yes gene_type:complete